MVVTVTNLSSTLALNELETLTAGTIATTGTATLLAVGGNRVRPLPYPFGHVTIAASGTSVLAMHQSDWTYQPIYGLPQRPIDQWNVLIQNGTLTMGFAAQAGVRDPMDLAINTI